MELLKTHSSDLPAGWSVHWSQRWQRVYFFESETGCSSWQAPNSKSNGKRASEAAAESAPNPAKRPRVQFLSSQTAAHRADHTFRKSPNHVTSNTATPTPAQPMAKARTTALIARHGRGGDAKSAIALFREAASARSVSASMLKAVLKATQHAAVDVVGNLARDVYAGLDRWAVKMDGTLATLLLNSLWRSQAVSEAHAFFGKLKAQQLADVYQYTVQISNLARNGQLASALELLEDGSKMRIAWNDRSFCALLVACGKAGALSVGQRVHDIAVAHKAEQGIEYCNSLLDMYARCVAFAEAEALFADMERRGLADAISHTILINGYAHCRMVDKAFAAFEHMKQAGVKPSCVTYTAMLGACSHGGLVAKAKALMAEMTSFGVRVDSRHHNGLIDVLARAGELAEAERYLLSRAPTSVVAHMALIGGCRKHADAERAKRIYEHLLSLPDCPDDYFCSASIVLANLLDATQQWAEQKRVLQHLHERGLPVGAS